MKLIPNILSLSILMVHSFAQAETQQAVLSQAVVAENLPMIEVTAQEQAHDVGKKVYTQQQLQQQPSSNKTISDVLKTHPNVQFDKSAQSAGTQGEIFVQDVSINGALFYDNKILLDNMDISNQINPAQGMDNHNNFTALPGKSNAVTINTDLLCELQVLDSNVSVAYGEFSGGVIHAKSCIPKTKVGELHGRISYDYSSSDWTRYNYASPKEMENFEDNTSVNFQKNYVKQGLSATLYTNATEQLALSLSASKRWSDIELKSRLADERAYPQQRETQNVNLGLAYDIHEKHQMNVKLGYQNDQDTRTQANSLNSYRDNESNHLSADLEFKHHFNRALITQNLSYQHKENQRKTDYENSIIWRTSPAKDWSNSTVASEGGAGELAYQQHNVQYDLKANFKPISWWNILHQVNMGAGYKHYHVDWSQPQTWYSYFAPSATKGASTCTRADGSVDAYCDTTYLRNGQQIGQFHERRTVYQAGDIHLSQDNWYAFLEDSLNWQNKFKAQLGLRYDYDSLSQHHHVAPRTKFEYLPFAKPNLKFTAGWNRYYSQNAFIYALQDGINQLNYEERRNNIDDVWTLSGQGITSNVARSKLKSPYSNEAVFAISGEQGLIDWQVKYVHRDFKDQVRKTRISTSPIINVYDNLGRSESDVYSLQLQNKIPVRIGSTQHQWSFATDYSKVYRNFTDYDDSISLSQEPAYVLYKGNVIAYQDIPAENFNQPLTFRLGWNIGFDHIPLTLNHHLRYRRNYQAIVSSTIPVAQRFEHQGEVVSKRYDVTTMGSAFEWDMKAMYEFKLPKQTQLQFGLTVNNVLNRKNKYVSSGTTLASEVGRQFLADVSFKF